MDTSPNGYYLLRLLDASLWLILYLWTGEDHTAPPYLWEGPSLRGSAGGWEAMINLAQASRVSSPAYQGLPQVQTSLGKTTSHHLQPTTPSIPLPVVVFEIANPSFFLSCWPFPKQKPQSVPER